jgi:tRNA modification GTPase
LALDSQLLTLRSSITLLTPRGRGAVATLRFEGSCESIDRFFAAANGKPLEQQALNRVVFGHWGREIREEVVLCRTSEKVAEIHCHGGDAAADSIRRDLTSQGTEIESWPEMLQRTEGIFLREWAEAISKATTQRTAEVLLAQRELFPQAIRDFESGVASDLPSRIDSLLEWAEFGRHLTRPWSVVLGGPPNVGKSSLINALVGYARSIVFNQPGTTRDVVTAETAIAGWPILLADTAGLRDRAEVLEAEGIARAKNRLASADCRILLFDVSQPPAETDRPLREEFPDAIFVAHKSDLPRLPSQELPADALPVSSLTGEGVEQLLSTIVNRLIPKVPKPDQPIPCTDRQVDLLTKAREAAVRGDVTTTKTILGDLLGIA